jgi:uncharacterized coiled-coil protein SlyX
MSKTIKKEPKGEDSKLTKLKNKLNDRKQQITRLKRTLRVLEHKLEKYEKGIVVGTAEQRPPKKEKTKIDKQQQDAQAKEELKRKLREQFKSGKVEND